MLHERHGDELNRRLPKAAVSGKRVGDVVHLNSSLSAAVDDLRFMESELERGRAQLQAGSLRIEGLEQQIIALESRAGTLAQEVAQSRIAMNSALENLAAAERERDAARDAVARLDADRIVRAGLEDQLAGALDAHRSAELRAQEMANDLSQLTRELESAAVHAAEVAQERDAARAEAIKAQASRTPLEEARAGALEAQHAAEERAFWLAAEISELRAEIENVAASAAQSEQRAAAIEQQNLSARDAQAAAEERSHLLRQERDAAIVAQNDAESRSRALVQQLNELESRIASMTARIATSEQERDAALDGYVAIQQQAEDFAKQVEELRRQAEETAARLEQAELERLAAIARVEKAELRITGLEVQLKDAAGALGDARNETAAWLAECELLLDEADSRTAEIERLSREHGSMEQELLLALTANGHLLQSLQEAETSVASMEARVDEIAAVRQNLEDSIREISTALSQAMADEQNLFRDLDAAQKAADLHAARAAQAEGVSVNLSAELVEARNRIGSYAEREQALRADLEAAQGEVRLQLERRRQEADEFGQSVLSLNAALTNALARASAAEVDRGKLLSEVSHLRASADQLSSTAAQRHRELSIENERWRKRAQSIENEMAAERETTVQLIEALGEAEESASAMQVRLNEIAAGRAQLEEAVRLSYESLADAEAKMISAERDRSALKAALAEVHLREQHLAGQLDQRSRERDEARQESRSLSRSLESAQEIIGENRSRIEDTERHIRRLEKQVSDGEQYVRSLLNQLKEKEEQISQGSAYARRLESEVSERNRDKEMLIAELEAVRKAALSDKMVMREYVGALREQVAELPALREANQQLVTQTEELIAAVQSESAEISILIDTVQASHFWRLKRFLNRIRTRVLRR